MRAMMGPLLIQQRAIERKEHWPPQQYTSVKRAEALLFSPIPVELTPVSVLACQYHYYLVNNNISKKQGCKRAEPSRVEFWPYRVEPDELAIFKLELEKNENNYFIFLKK